MQHFPECVSQNQFFQMHDEKNVFCGHANLENATYLKIHKKY